MDLSSVYEYLQRYVKRHCPDLRLRACWNQMMNFDVEIVDKKRQACVHRMEFSSKMFMVYPRQSVGSALLDPIRDFCAQWIEYQGIRRRRRTEWIVAKKLDRVRRTQIWWAER